MPGCVPPQGRLASEQINKAQEDMKLLYAKTAMEMKRFRGKAVQESVRKHHADTNK